MGTTPRERDEREIRDLVARYSDAVNRRDAGAWGETWAVDARWRLGGRITHGRDAIVRRWTETMERVPFVLQLPSFGVIDLDAPGPRGRWYIQEIVQRPSGSSITFGVYADHYVHEEGRWRFARRRFDALYRGADDPDAAWTAFPTNPRDEEET